MHRPAATAAASAAAGLTRRRLFCASLSLAGRREVHQRPLQSRHPGAWASVAAIGPRRNDTFVRSASSAASSTSSTCESEWKLYLALDKRDEASHVALARFVNGLWQLHAQAHKQLDADGNGKLSKDELAKHGHDRGLARQHVVKVQGASSSIRLPKNITPAVAKEFLERCRAGGVLAASDLERLLRQTRQALLAEPAINRVPAPKAEGTSVIVVGDLHGSISDLAKVVELGGAPGKTTYIFNGDFVDRGRHSVEVMACLCALKLAHPTSVFLNRGNHECKALSRSYGLQREVKSKYKGPIALSLFEDLASVFASLPLGVVIGGGEGDLVRALVVHGGIPSDTSVGLKEIELGLGLDREGRHAQRVCKREGMKSSLQIPDTQDFETKFLEDLLWSDPATDDRGVNIRFNEGRKAGCTYSLGAADIFLRKEGLTTLVRSHEVMREGVEWWRCAEGTELYTVFSCSNYPDKRGLNEAAALKFGPQPLPMVKGQDSARFGGLTGLEVVRWRTSAREEPKAAIDLTTCNRQARNTVQSLAGLIARHKHAIVEACEAAEDKERESGSQPPGHRQGVLSVAAWSEAMSEWGASAGLTLPSVDWVGLLPLLTLSSGKKVAAQEAVVDYQALMSRFYFDGVGQDSGMSEKDIMSLYDHHEELSVIFAWIDTDNSGTLSLDEVKKAVEVLNALGGDHVDAEALFLAMDIDSSGSLDRHEFMECFRLVSSGGA